MKQNPLKNLQILSIKTLMKEIIHDVKCGNNNHRSATLNKI